MKKTYLTFLGLEQGIIFRLFQKLSFIFKMNKMFYLLLLIFMKYISKGELSSKNITGMYTMTVCTQIDHEYKLRIYSSILIRLEFDLINIFFSFRLYNFCVDKYVYNYSKHCYFGSQCYKVFGQKFSLSRDKIYSNKARTFEIQRKIILLQVI